MADLLMMDRRLLEFHMVYHRVVAPKLGSEGDYIKYHKMSHFTSMVRRLGVSKHYNAQFV